MRKKVIILLTPAWLECLKAHADGACRACLEGAIDVRRVFTASDLAYSVSCSEEEVRAILKLAMRHCRDAVPALEDSLARFTATA